MNKMSLMDGVLGQKPRRFWHTVDMRRQTGFTLVELLIVILIIGILATIAIPVFNGQRAKAKNAASQEIVRTALQAAKSFYIAHNETYDNLTPTALRAEDASLSLQLPGSDPNYNSSLIAGGAGANPSTVFVSDGTGNHFGAVDYDPITYGVIICSVSRGTRAFCVKSDGINPDTYASGSGLYAARGAATTSTARSW